MRLVTFLILFFIAFNSFAGEIDTEIQETEKSVKFLKGMKLQEKMFGTAGVIRTLSAYGFKGTEIENFYGSKLDQRTELMETRLANLKQQKIEQETAKIDCESIHQTDAVYTGVNDIADDMIKDGGKSGGIDGAAGMLYGGMLKAMFGAIPQGVKQGNSNCYPK
jgi:hypothetical protein